MLNLILISLTYAQYNQYASPQLYQPYNTMNTQYGLTPGAAGYNPATATGAYTATGTATFGGMPYRLLKQGIMCKNKGRRVQGELSVPEAVVLQNSGGGTLGCAQSVIFHRRQGMCGDVFFTNENQCACLAPGVICKEDRSETGFSIYQLTVLGSTHKEVSHEAAAVCVGLPEPECAKSHGCEWSADACSSHPEIKLGKVHYADYGAPAPVQPMYGQSPTLMQGQYGAGAMGGVQQPWRMGFDCDRELDETTGISNIVDLSPARTANECYMYASQNPQCNKQQYVWQQRADGFPGECSCVRVGYICDEETRPGWNIYDLARGAGMGMAGAMPGAPGAYTGARPGMPGAMPGVAGAYPATGMGAYPAARPGMAGAYPGAAGAYPRQPGYGGIRLQKSNPVAPESSNSTMTDFHFVMLYVALPSVILMCISGLIGVYLSRRNSKNTFYESMLTDGDSRLV